MSTWYVRPASGTYGAADGTTYATAWDGWTNVVWGVGGVVAGDTLYAAGTFTDEYANVEDSGSAGSPITIRGDYPDDLGILDGDENQTGAIRIAAYDYITVRNITLRNGTFAGLSAANAANSNIQALFVTVDGGSSHGINIIGDDALVEDCDVSGVDKSGIVVTASANAIIRRCTVIDCGPNDAGSNEDGIFIGNASYDYIVEYNTVTGFLGTAGGVAGIDVSTNDATPRAGIIRYNRVSACEVNGIKISDGTEVHNVSIYYNVLYNNPTNLFINAGGTQTVYNNVFYGATSRNIWVQGNPTAALTITVKNNIHGISSAGYYVWLNDSTNCTFNFSYNCYTLTDNFRYEADGKTFIQWQALSLDDTGSINVDPAMVDPANGNFNLAAVSPCRNTGVDVSLTTDYRGRKIIGGTPDIGAYEFFLGPKRKFWSRETKNINNNKK